MTHANPIKHTTAENYEHFLSYMYGSGARHSALLCKAYFDGADAPHEEYEAYMAEHPEQHEQPQPDAICQESDGCPTELAILQQFWRDKQAEQEPVCECDCETDISPDGSRMTKCGSNQMRSAVKEGHAFCKQPMKQEPVACSHTNQSVTHYSNETWTQQCEACGQVIKSGTYINDNGAITEEKEMSKIKGPTYYVRHPNETYSVADPQPVEFFVLTEDVV